MWFAYRELDDFLFQLQYERAEAAAIKFGHFGWTPRKPVRQEQNAYCRPRCFAFWQHISRLTISAFGEI